MKRITNSAQRKAARVRARHIKAHPELAPNRAARGAYQPTFELTTGRAGHATKSEAQFAKLMRRLGVECAYEPFVFGIGRRQSGSVRSFQPDFWLPELGIVVELCANVQAKNQKVRLISRGWSRLPVLVLSDQQVKEMAAMSGLTKWQFICLCTELLQQQTIRVQREGDDPNGYRRQNSGSRPRRRGRRLARAT